MFLSLPDTVWTTKKFPPWGIFHCKVFSKPWQCWTQGVFLSDTLGCNFFHHQTFSTSRSSPHWKHFLPQDIFSFDSLAHVWLPVPKIWISRKKVSYHYSDRILYIRLIQNESLTPPLPHKGMLIHSRWPKTRKVR